MMRKSVLSHLSLPLHAWQRLTLKKGFALYFTAKTLYLLHTVLITRALCAGIVKKGSAVPVPLASGEKTGLQIFSQSLNLTFRVWFTGFSCVRCAQLPLTLFRRKLKIAVRMQETEPILLNWDRVEEFFERITTDYEKELGLEVIHYYAALKEAPPDVSASLEVYWNYRNQTVPVLVNAPSNSEVAKKVSTRNEKVRNFVNAANHCELYTYILDRLMKEEKVRLVEEGVEYELSATHFAITSLEGINPLVYTQFDGLDIGDVFACQKPMLLKDVEGSHRVLFAEFANGTAVCFDASSRQLHSSMESMLQPRIAKYFFHDSSFMLIDKKIEIADHLTFAKAFCHQRSYNAADRPHIFKLFRDLGWDKVLLDAGENIDEVIKTDHDLTTTIEHMRKIAKEIKQSCQVEMKLHQMKMGDDESEDSSAKKNGHKKTKKKK